MSALSHISELFGQAVYLKYTSLRFGLKSCQNSVDYERAYNLMTMLKRENQRQSCGLTTDVCCSKSNIEETINTL